ncbi:MAG: hypothetical protein V1854_06270 [Methanobacteriota archaeon]
MKNSIFMFIYEPQFIADSVVFSNLKIIKSLGVSDTTELRLFY